MTTKVKKLSKTEQAKDLFFNKNLTTSVIASRLGVSQQWVCNVINK